MTDGRTANSASSSSSSSSSVETAGSNRTVSPVITTTADWCRVRGSAWGSGRVAAGRRLSIGWARIHVASNVVSKSSSICFVMAFLGSQLLAQTNLPDACTVAPFGWSLKTYWTITLNSAPYLENARVSVSLRQGSCARAHRGGGGGAGMRGRQEGGSHGTSGVCVFVRITTMPSVSTATRSTTCTRVGPWSPFGGSV
jgi:hypothetical protein